jgi:hypothetical protein
MADAQTYIKDPNESMIDFNKRMKTACEEMDVTDFQLVVVDGEPMVTLLSGMVPATEEDIEELKEADPEAELPEVGDPIPEDDSLIVQCAKVSAMTPTTFDAKGGVAEKGDALKSEKRLETLYVRANGGVVKHVHAVGKYGRFVDTADKKQVWAEVVANYVAVGYVPGEEEEAK